MRNSARNLHFRFLHYENSPSSVTVEKNFGVIILPRTAWFLFAGRWRALMWTAELSFVR
jgi:hypothetical protein